MEEMVFEHRRPPGLTKTEGRFASVWALIALGFVVFNVLLFWAIYSDQQSRVQDSKVKQMEVERMQHAETSEEDQE